VQRRAGVGITRRMILLGALSPIAACVADTTWLVGGRRNLASWLRALAPGWRAAALGARYLRDQPAERSADWLARRLFDSELSRQLDPAGFDALLDKTFARRAQDFIDDDLVVLDGWAVARTEARLLALIALCAGM
jgi:hypothetical protein